MVSIKDYSNEIFRENVSFEFVSPSKRKYAVFVELNEDRKKTLPQETNSSNCFFGKCSFKKRGKMSKRRIVFIYIEIDVLFWKTIAAIKRRSLFRHHLHIWIKVIIAKEELWLIQGNAFLKELFF